jgi:hypothetical protein
LKDQRSISKYFVPATVMATMDRWMNQSWGCGVVAPRWSLVPGTGEKAGRSLLAGVWARDGPGAERTGTAPSMHTRVPLPLFLHRCSEVEARRPVAAAANLFQTSRAEAWQVMHGDELLCETQTRQLKDPWGTLNTLPAKERTVKRKKKFTSRVGRGRPRRPRLTCALARSAAAATARHRHRSVGAAQGPGSKLP